MQLKKSVKEESLNLGLPKLLGKRETSAYEGRESKQKLLLHKKNKVSERNHFRNQAKIIKELSEELITEKKIKSSQNGESKVLFRKSAQSVNYREK